MAKFVGLPSVVKNTTASDWENSKEKVFDSQTA